jgi:hypothetical protein
MAEQERHRTADLAPWVFLFALMAVAITIVLTTFALPGSPLSLP